MKKNLEQADISQKKKGVSRRSFLTGTGSASVAIAASGLLGPAASSAQGKAGAQAGRDTTEPPIPAKVAAPAKTEFACDVLVVGGGFAGLMAAVSAREAGQSVVLIDKGRPGYSGLSAYPRSHLFFDARRFLPLGASCRGIKLYSE